jgi:hypothetical protein
MTSIVMPICMVCKHYWRDAKGWGYKCAAFPDGIPDTIILSEIDHRAPVEGDHGIQFAPVDNRGAEYAAELFGDEVEAPPSKTEVA